MNVEIRAMVTSDVRGATAVHAAAFPAFFLSFLGPRFLRELYRAILADEEGIAIVAVAGERLIGFAAGAADGGFFRRAGRRRWWRFGWAALGALVRKPVIGPRLLRALFSPPAMSTEGACLVSLAVDPDAQRRGEGRRLVRAFVDEARRRGAARVVLTTDHDGNRAVNAFYEGLGFVLADVRVTREGRALNEYVLAT